MNRHHTDSQIHRGLLTRGWWRRFIRRHPSLTMKTPAASEQSRAQQAGPHIFNEWFKLLEATMQELKITSGSQIWNADETGFKLDPLPRKVVCDKKQKNLPQQVHHTNDHITVHICVNAAGRALPPHVIYSRKQLRSGLLEGGPDDTLFSCSPKGSMTGPLYLDWFEVFLKHTSRDQAQVSSYNRSLSESIQKTI